MNKTELRRIIKNYEAMTQPEPCRPLTWAELMKVRKETPLFYENRINKTMHWRIVKISARMASLYNSDYTADSEKARYNKEFRYWPRVPTRRERKAAKWEA